jgi:predicted nucleotidyltransferase
VLGLLYGKPDDTFYANQVCRIAALGKGTVMRELERLHKAGVIVMTKQGNQTHYRANPHCPIYKELLGIIRKTTGVAEPIREALSGFSGSLAWAFIYGSIAKGDAHSQSDVDVLLIGDQLNYGEVMEHLMPVEELLGRTINPVLYTLEDWLAKRADGNSFVTRVEAQDKVELFGFNPMESEDGES